MSVLDHERDFAAECASAQRSVEGARAFAGKVLAAASEPRREVWAYWHAEGKSLREIAAASGVDHTRVWQALKAEPEQDS